MSVAVVGAMAFAVSVQGSPRAGERGKTDGKSATSRLVTGPSANINDAIAAGGGASMTLQPVAPKTDPASTYPGGTTIVGQTITMGSVPARVWLEVLTTGWPSASGQCARTVQARVDAADVEMNGGGYSGAGADCGGQPATGAGDITNAVQACASTAVCRQTMSGRTSSCFAGEPNACSAGFCPYGFIDGCDPEYIAAGFNNIPAADTATMNFRAGTTLNEPEDACMNDFAPSYVATLVIQVPSNAKGTYTLDFGITESFLLNGQPAPNNNIPITSFNPAIVKIACGSCCFGVGGAAPGCTNSLSQAECAALAQPAIFTPDGSCLNPPSDEGCCACLTNSQCNDNDACTTDVCNNCVCANNPKASWDQVNECCDAASGAETLLGCADQCEAASCSAGTNRGTAICTPTPGADCDDENPCTYDDTCATGAGSCAGLDANLVACPGGSADCAAATGVGYPCIDGFCNCTLTPDLDIEIIDLGEENCFEDGEKVTACVHVAASSSPVNGGQFLISYDNTCLDYNSTIEQAPFTNSVYGPVVNEGAGTIFVAVGVEFGAGDGPNGNADLVCFSFTKIGDCNSCQICPLNNNPQNTYLTDNEGQRITVQANCSKSIFDESDMELTTPGNSKTNVDCDRPTATESWDAPSATDECGTAQVFCRGEHESGLQYDADTVNNGGELPIGASSFCCYAVSDGDCGTTVGCPPDTTCADGDQDGRPDGCWTVTVNDETSLDITVGLSPTSQSKPGDSLTRCIKFTLYSNCVQEPLVFSDDVTFGGMFDFVGKSTGKIKIPGSGQWDCITAQDQLHTLRSCFTFAANGSDCVNGQLHAQFSGDPRLGGNWLIGGNLDGWKKDDPNANPSLDVIDILDFGTFVAEYLSNYGSTDTPCGTAGPNADINGDGIVDLDDYAFVSANFLVSAKQCCCGPQTASATPVTEISVAQLRADGYADLSSADLNGDGMLNLADMASFDQGVRPTKKSTTKGGSRAGSR